MRHGFLRKSQISSESRGDQNQKRTHLLNKSSIDYGRESAERRHQLIEIILYQGDRLTGSRVPLKRADLVTRLYTMGGDQ